MNLMKCGSINNPLVNLVTDLESFHVKILKCQQSFDVFVCRYFTDFFSYQYH